MARAMNAVVDDNDKWKAESDMRTLMAAEAIKNDPKRFKAAQRAAKEKLEEMESAFPEAEGKDEED